MLMGRIMGEVMDIRVPGSTDTVFESRGTYPVVSILKSTHYASGTALVLYHPSTGKVMAFDANLIMVKNENFLTHDMRFLDESKVIEKE